MGPPGSANETSAAASYTDWPAPVAADCPSQGPPRSVLARLSNGQGALKNSTLGGVTLTVTGRKPNVPNRT